MENFLRKHGSDVTGIVNGFDRLVFRGHLRMLSFVEGMSRFLSRTGVLLKQFGEYAEATSQRLKETSLAEANRLGRSVKYLPSAATRKEDEARAIAERDGLTEGLVAVLKSVEPCQSYDIHRNRALKKLQLVSRPRTCLHLYHYWIDPVFGWMNARIQTWFPFPIQVCLNGREWLARRLDAARVAYRRQENGFLWIEQPEQAQALMDELLHTVWPRALDAIARRLNPAHGEILAAWPQRYYWSAHQTEWATDLMFRSTAALDAIYPALTRGAIACFSSPDVMRFLGRKLHGRFAGELTGDYKHRPEGVRIKHSVRGNSVKLYNKHGSILRAETTVNRARDIKVYRRAEGHPKGKRAWRPLRKGVADLHRRAQVSQRCNERYLDALSALDTSLPLGELAAPVCRRATYGGHPMRALRPWTEEDRHLLAAVNRGEFALNGFRNRDLAGLLFPGIGPDRQSSARVTRWLRMLRAHHLIRKIPRTHRYQLTSKGRKIVTAILQVQQVSLEQLNKAAA